MADIVLKDRNGNSIEYPGVNHIKVKTTDGETRDFVDSETVPEVVENMPIALDFSGGDQEIVAPDGMVVKSAIIQQPATLIPENIAEGVNIAGIVGALAGGGNVKIASGTFTGNNGAVTVTHGLGVTPDIFCVRATFSPSSTPSTYFLDHWVGISAAIQTVSGFPMCQYGAAFSTVSIAYRDGRSANYPIETTVDTFLNKANEQTITVGRSSGVGSTYKGTYSWLAIGGLT